MASNRDDGAGLNHPMVKKQGSASGAAKNASKTDTGGAENGTTSGKRK